jgi:hypothetical protein
MAISTVAKILRAEGWYSKKTTVYHIELASGGSVPRLDP